MNYKKFSNDECLICFNDVEPKQDFIKCNNCSIVYHKKCFDEWVKTKNADINKCLHCTISGKLEITKFSLFSKLFNCC